MPVVASGFQLNLELNLRSSFSHVKPYPQAPSYIKYRIEQCHPRALHSEDVVLLVAYNVSKIILAGRSFSFLTPLN